MTLSTNVTPSTGLVALYANKVRKFGSLSVTSFMFAELGYISNVWTFGNDGIFGNSMSVTNTFKLGKSYNENINFFVADKTNYKMYLKYHCCGGKR